MRVPQNHGFNNFGWFGVISENKQHITNSNFVWGSEILPYIQIIDLPQTPLRPQSSTATKGPQIGSQPGRVSPQKYVSWIGITPANLATIWATKKGSGSTKSMKKHKLNLNFSSKNWKYDGLINVSWHPSKKCEDGINHTTEPCKTEDILKGLLIHVRTGQGTWGCTPSSGSSNLRAALAVLKTWDPTHRSPGWVFWSLLMGTTPWWENP